MKKIKKKLTNLIQQINDGIPIDHYIEVCLNDEEGYYKNKQPIGKEGDFITAPEISQLFGEIIGLYIYDQWLNNIKCEFNLIELGPGKGTLMSDILRINKNFKSFNSSMNINLIEINNHLINLQKKTLKNNQINTEKIIWNTKYNFTDNKPLILIANEFFDCFAIKQFIRYRKEWYEKKIYFNQKEDKFYIRDAIVREMPLCNQLEKYSIKYNIQDNQIVEISVTRNQYFEEICQYINKNTGIALIIDYGYFLPPKYSTLQSMSFHHFTNILEQPGNQDITSHVDFNEFINIAKKYNLCVNEPTTQRDFLITNGINERKEKILSKASKMEKISIENDCERLISKKQMGTMFKCLIVKNYKTNNAK